MIHQNRILTTFCYPSPKNRIKCSYRRTLQNLFYPSNLDLDRAMQERDNQFDGICHRLFNFIMNNIISRGLKRVTSGPRPVSHGPTEVPIGGSIRINGDGSMEDQPPINSAKPHEEELRLLHPPAAAPGKSEIIVEFKHTNGLEYWTPVDKLGSSVHLSDKDRPIVSGDHQTQLQKGDDKSASHETAGISNIGTSLSEVQEKTGRGQKKRVTIEEGAEKREKNKTKEKNIPTETSGRGSTTDFFSNINQKSDEFIRKTKEAMKRNLSLDPKA